MTLKKLFKRNRQTIPSTQAPFSWPMRWGVRLTAVLFLILVISYPWQRSLFYERTGNLLIKRWTPILPRIDQTGNYIISDFEHNMFVLLLNAEGTPNRLRFPDVTADKATFRIKGNSTCSIRPFPNSFVLITERCQIDRFPLHQDEANRLYWKLSESLPTEDFVQELNGCRMIKKNGKLFSRLKELCSRREPVTP